MEQLLLKGKKMEPKIHCRGVDIHYNRPVCGKLKNGEKCVDRVTFNRVGLKNQCRSCAATRYARFL